MKEKMREYYEREQTKGESIREYRNGLWLLATEAGIITCDIDFTSHFVSGLMDDHIGVVLKRNESMSWNCTWREVRRLEKELRLVSVREPVMMPVVSAAEPVVSAMNPIPKYVCQPTPIDSSQTDSSSIYTSASKTKGTLVDGLEKTVGLLDKSMHYLPPEHCSGAQLTTVIQPPKIVTIEPVVSAMEPVIMPVVSAMDPQMKAIEPVLMPVVSAMEPVIMPVVSAMDLQMKAIEPVLMQVVSAAEPVVSAMNPMMEPVEPDGKPVELEVRLVTEPMNPVVELIESAVEPVRLMTESMNPVVELIEPVLMPLVSAAEPVESAIEPVTSVMEPMNQ